MTELEMTRSDRTALLDLAKSRARVAKQQVAVREAEMIAEVEEQLSTIHKAEDEAWAEIVQEARAAADAANQRIREVCRARGIPDEMHPKVGTGFLGRGSNGNPARRVELRKLALARIAAVGKAAKTAIDTRALEVQTDLVVGGLSSEAARAAVNGLPTVAELMPSVDVRALPGGAR